jgi:hypothetical protein
VGRCSLELEAVFHISAHPVLLLSRQEPRLEIDMVHHILKSSPNYCCLAKSVENPPNGRYGTESKAEQS